MDIDKFNKKCADFLGYKYITHQEAKILDVSPGWWTKVPKNNNRKINGHLYLGRSLKDLRFYNDWNWIHTVINKIRKEGWRFDTSHSGSVSSRDIDVFIWQKYPGGGETELIECSNENPKIVTIEAIDKFIDWYNEYNTNKIN